MMQFVVPLLFAILLYVLEGYMDKSKTRRGDKACVWLIGLLYQLLTNAHVSYVMIVTQLAYNIVAVHVCFVYSSI